jgi:2-(1,2-epoxy-1,2-dihydrophenyl)acetyl-CoA isomerase
VVRTEKTGNVVHIILDRPDAYNAIDPPLRDELLAAIDTAESDGTRCLLLRGEGRGFCAGMDLKAGTGLRGVELAASMRTSSSRISERLLRTPLPLVSAVHGVCAGMGLTLALAADHCVAAESARFFAAFVKRSIVPDGAAAMILPRLIGMARARRLLLFGEEVGARQALEWGMVGEVVPDDTLIESAHLRAEELAALPTHVVMYTKSLLSRSFDIGLDTVLFEERLAQGVVSTSDDYAEGVNAFLEHRPARFGGS